MLGVLEQLRRSQKHLVKPDLTLDEAGSKAVELQTAKEILAEIFRASSSDVEDMIQRRLASESQIAPESRSEGMELWPDMFWVNR